MADSFIQLPADGAGKELDTRTQPDGEHREVIVIGDPAATDVVSASAANGLEVDVTRVQGAVAVTDNGGSLTVDGTVAVTDGGGTISVDDGGGAITVDGSVSISGPVTVQDGGSTISIDDGGGTLTVDGTVSVSGTVDTELPVAAALADDTATPTAPAVGAFGMMFDGTTWDRVRGTSADGMLVNLGTNNDVVVSDGGGSITVDGTVSVTEPVSVDDNGGSLTVDNPALSVTGGGAEASALRVTIASDSTGVVSVDDNGSTLSVDDGGGSLTVDGTVAVTDGGGSLTVDGTVGVSGTVTVDSELPNAAALADNTANPTAPAVGAFGMLWDGAAWDRAPGTSADGQLVNLGANNDVVISDGGGSITVDGTVSVTEPVSVDDNGGSLTVDNAVLSVTGGGVESSALRVTIASDSTGVLSVDDNGGTLSVDDGGGTLTVDGTVAVTDGGGSLTVDGTVSTLAEESATGTTTSVNDSNANQTLLASNTSRLGFSIFNDSDQLLYVKMGATATTTDYGVRLSPGGYYEDAARYTGRVDGIWAANSTGAAKITEYT